MKRNRGDVQGLVACEENRQGRLEAEDAEQEPMRIGNQGYTRGKRGETKLIAMGTSWTMIHVTVQNEEKMGRDLTSNGFRCKMERVHR